MFGIVAAASESRLARCVRSGPIVPVAFVPAIVWQYSHAEPRKHLLAALEIRVRRRRRRRGLRASQSSNFAFGSATT